MKLYLEKLNSLLKEIHLGLDPKKNYEAASEYLKENLLGDILSKFPDMDKLEKFNNKIKDATLQTLEATSNIPHVEMKAISRLQKLKKDQEI